MIESPGFYPNLTGTENLRIFATLRGVPNNHAIKDALDLVGLPYHCLLYTSTPLAVYTQQTKPEQSKEVDGLAPPHT